MKTGRFKVFDFWGLRTRIVDLIHRMRHIETLHWLSCDHWRCMPSRTTARVQNEFGLPTIRCREPATPYLLGLARTVLS
jgi:hypothetical protein